MVRFAEGCAGAGGVERAGEEEWWWMAQGRRGAGAEGESGEEGHC